LAAQGVEALTLKAPSDHAATDASAFRAAVEVGVAAAQSSKLVFFCITPCHAETEYDCLELAEALRDGTPPFTDLTPVRRKARLCPRRRNGGERSAPVERGFL